MVLPLYLAMTRQEMEETPILPRNVGWLSCFFSSAASGVWDLPDTLPPGAMLVLTDRLPFGGSPEPITTAVKKLNCGSVLLDFEKKPNVDTKKVADALFEALPCPLAAPPGFVAETNRPIFLPPCPLHVPLAEYLRPWQGREIWLDVTLQQQTITVTPDGTRYGPAAPADRQDGIWDDVLMCQSITEFSGDEVRFTLFDTPETLKLKLDQTAGLGVSRAIGLYQELVDKL